MIDFVLLTWGLVVLLLGDEQEQNCVSAWRPTLENSVQHLFVCESLPVGIAVCGGAASGYHLLVPYGRWHNSSTYRLLQWEVSDFSSGPYLMSHYKSLHASLHLAGLLFCERAASVRSLLIVLQDINASQRNQVVFWRWWASPHITQLMMPKLVSVLRHLDQSRKSAGSGDSQSSLMKREHKLNFKGSFWMFMSFFSKLIKAELYPARRKLEHLKVSCSASNRVTKMDSFSLLELCLEAAINEFVFVPCDGTNPVST